jgi:hypothetical protein
MSRRRAVFNPRQNYSVSALILAVLLALGASTHAEAQGDRWNRQVRASFERLNGTLLERGYRATDQYRIGLLNEDESVWVPLTLEPGHEYAVVGNCDQDCTALDLILSESGRKEIDADRSGGRVPIVRGSADAGRQYRVRVVMTGCRMSPCRFGVLVYRKPPAAIRPD